MSTVSVVHDNAATRGHDLESVLCNCLQALAFEPPEMLLAVLVEDVFDGLSGVGYDLIVDVDEAPAQSPGDLPAHGRLARAREPGYEDGLIQRCVPMRRR